MPLLKLSQLLHDVVFEPLSILSDFKDKSQYYFPNLNVYGKNCVREQFCHQLDFFDLQTAKKSLTVQLAEICDLVSRDEFNRLLHYEGEEIRFARCQGCRLTALLRLLVCKSIFRIDKNQSETHAESACSQFKMP